MVNNPSLFEDTYKRYLLRFLRDHSPFQEVPIKLELRSKKEAQEGKRSDRHETPEGIDPKAEIQAPQPPKPKRKIPVKKPDVWKL
jgi:GTP-binding protein